MANAFLHVRDDLSGIGLEPAPVQVLGRKTELDDEIAREGPLAQPHLVFPATAAKGPSRHRP